MLLTPVASFAGLLQLPAVPLRQTNDGVKSSDGVAAPRNGEKPSMSAELKTMVRVFSTPHLSSQL